MTIEWPNGAVDVHAPVAVNRIVTAVENGGLTGIGDARGSAPLEFTLFQNFPNPFNPGTKISFRLASAGFTSLRVFDVLGKEVAALVHGWTEAGDHTVDFSRNDLASGMYVYRLRAGAFTESRKFVLLR
jgi:hypothetical protein